MGVENDMKRKSVHFEHVKCVMIKRSYKAYVLKVIKSLLPVFLIATILYICFYGGKILSSSMKPTVKKGDFVLANKLAYLFENPCRGDVIVFYSKEYDRVMIKRVIGVEGDEISFANGRVYINGCAYEEPYLKSDMVTFAMKNFSVPKDTVFVMGDNRLNSSDSRYWVQPYISLKDVYGKVFLIL